MRFLPHFIHSDTRVEKVGISAIYGCRILPVFVKMIQAAKACRKILLENGRLRLYGSGGTACSGTGLPRVLEIFCLGQTARRLIIQITIEDIGMDGLPVTRLYLRLPTGDIPAHLCPLPVAVA